MINDNAPRIVGVAVCLCLGALIGCGSDTAAYVPVSGAVTLDGKPLAGAGVSFEPKRRGDPPARGSVGKTDENGQFELETAERGVTGAAPGPHVVRFFPPEGQPPLNLEDITFEVPEDGTDEANFNLTSK
jgi:hypothetical protein